MSYKTQTHQNVGVWARRMGVKIENLDRAAEIAERLYGDPSRKACIAVAAMKLIKEKLGHAFGSPNNFYGAVAIAAVVYDATYRGVGGSLSQAYETYESVIELALIQGHINQEVLTALMSEKHVMVGMALDALGARNREKQSNITNAILAKARC
jgi:hypothetical protein